MAGQLKWTAKANLHGTITCELSRTSYSLMIPLPTAVPAFVQITPQLEIQLTGGVEAELSGTTNFVAGFTRGPGIKQDSRSIRTTTQSAVRGTASLSLYGGVGVSVELGTQFASAGIGASIGGVYTLNTNTSVQPCWTITGALRFRIFLNLTVWKKVWTIDVLSADFFRQEITRGSCSAPASGSAGSGSGTSSPLPIGALGGGGPTSSGGTGGLAIGPAVVSLPSDGVLTRAAVATGFVPWAWVDFASNPADTFYPGQADANGDRPMYLQCMPGDAGASWTVSATERATGRIASMTLHCLATGAAPTSLTVSFSENPYRCDGGERPMGTVTGADPGETIRLSSTSPGVGALASRIADGSGRATIWWQCNPSEAPATWTVTATGLSSARNTTYSVVGLPTAVPGALSVSFSENPYRCDGGERPFGTISDAAPGEVILLSSSSPGVVALASKMADGSGHATIWWQCNPNEAPGSWVVSARGAASGRSVSYGITGVAASAPPPSALSISLSENPFRCDGGLRTMGMLTGQIPAKPSGSRPRD